MSPVLVLCRYGSGDKGMMVQWKPGFSWWAGLHMICSEQTQPVGSRASQRAPTPTWTGSYPRCRSHPGAASSFFTWGPMQQKLGAVQLFCTHFRIKCPSCLSPHTHPTATALPRHRESSCVLMSKQLLDKISITIMQSDCGMQICINLFNLIKHLMQSPGKSIQSHFLWDQSLRDLHEFSPQYWESSASSNAFTGAGLCLVSGQRKLQTFINGKKTSWRNSSYTYRMRAPFPIVCEFHPFVCCGLHFFALVILYLLIKTQDQWLKSGAYLCQHNDFWEL